MSPPRRQRLTREQSQAQTRERLLVAARDLFVKLGFGGASIRDIAEAAGYSQGAFYSNFATKESVLLALLQRHMEEEAEQLSQALAHEGSARTDILSRLEEWSKTLNTDADWSMMAIELQLHANRSPEFANEYLVISSAHKARLGAFISALFERLALKPPAPTYELAEAFMALAQGLAIQRVTKSQDLAGKMIMVFLRALVLSADPI